MPGLLIVLLTCGCSSSTTGPDPELHPLWDHLYAFARGHDTQYAAGYTDAAFATIQVETSEADVERSLGAPLWQSWDYDDGATGCVRVTFRGNRVERLNDVGECQSLGIHAGMSAAEVAVLKGVPTRTVRSYSRSPGSHNYWRRVVSTSNGQVTKIDRRLYWD